MPTKNALALLHKVMIVGNFLLYCILFHSNIVLAYCEFLQHLLTVPYEGRLGGPRLHRLIVKSYIFVNDIFSCRPLGRGTLGTGFLRHALFPLFEQSRA